VFDSFLRLSFSRHNFAENGPRDLKTVSLERRVSQFYTICAKIQRLNKNIGKVMAILVIRCQKLGHSMHHRDPGPVPGGHWSRNFGKNDRPDLKMSCIDASRRHLQSA
jgi:hypothetical protein